jgi:hypothetical protein
VSASLGKGLHHDGESMLVGVSLTADLEWIAEPAASFAETKETLVGIVPTEPAAGLRLYLCAYQWSSGETSWLVLDGEGQPVVQRSLVRDTASIAALSELAEEAAGGGDLEDLRARLAELRATENAEGIDEAEAAVHELQAVLGSPPVLATPARLDAIGEATRRLELALGDGMESPFACMMRDSSESVQAFIADVEAMYKRELVA